jgi:ketosteroid isomerase-like protein
MHPNAELIERFYKAFQRRDGAAMAACYGPDATFSDPVFVGLRGEEPGAMWRMLCERAKDLEITYSGVHADDTTGGASWIARYTFTPTKRRVENHVRAEMRFLDGKIVEHRDHFDLWRWTRQALGPVGTLLGWSPLVTGKVRNQARAGLTDYLRGSPASR